MTREERNTKLKNLITCLKCEECGRECDANCHVQYEAGNIGEIIENLEAISKVLEQESWIVNLGDNVVYGTDGNLYKITVSSGKEYEQEPCEGWYDVPSDEMTLEQARQAVKDLRKKLAEHLEQEPCLDAISRQAAIDALYKMHMNGKEGVLHDLKTETGSDAFFVETIADAVEALEELPPVKPQPKTGHWILHNERDAEDSYKECSCCGHKQMFTSPLPNYCENCGAKMEGSDADSN